MNKRQVLVIAFFLIVFGLPLAWYLFLQMFGENKFVLPEMEQVTSSCPLPQGKAAVLLDERISREKPNERQRVITKLMEIGEVQLVENNGDSCKWSYDMSLVDHEGLIRGIYDFNRVEVDRFLAEVDIYVLNYQNGTSNRVQ